jgi:hypothetical protein
MQGDACPGLMSDEARDDERTVEFSIAAIGRRRFLRMVSAICEQHGVHWEWDLVGIPGLRNVEITFRGPGDALAAAQVEIDGWRNAERYYWSSGGSGTA